MKQYEELVRLLRIETQDFEKEILMKWIKRDGIKKVYKECLQIIKENKK